MTIAPRVWLTILLTTVPSLLPIHSILAAEGGGENKGPDPAQAVTIADGDIPVDELDLLLTPLTRDQLAVEAVAWRNLLEDKVREVSNAEIAIKHKDREIKQIEGVTQAVEGSSEAATENGGPDPAAGSDRIAEVAESIEAGLKPNEGTSPPAEAAEKAALEALRTATGESEPEQPVASDEPEVAEVVEQARAVASESGSSEELVAVADQATEVKQTLKEQLLEQVNVLRNERTMLIDRLNVVLDAWEAKGADPAKEVQEYRLYASAVSGLKVDVSDAEATWATVIGWLKSEEGGIRWALNIAKFLAILVAFMILAQILRYMTDVALRKSGSASELLRKVMVQTVKRGTQIVGLVVAASALEINIGPLLAVIGATGFVIAFALQDTLSNIASGLMIMLTRPFDVNDAIDVSGITGEVKSMNLVSTVVTTFDNKLMIVPNNSIWGNIITNINGSHVRRVDMVFGIGYDEDIDKAQALLEEIVAEHPLVLKEPEPLIQLHELADSSVNFICRPWAKTEDLWTVFWDVTRTVKKRFDAENISIPYPQRDVHLYRQSPASVALEPAAAETVGGKEGVSGRHTGSELELPDEDKPETDPE